VQSSRGFAEAARGATALNAAAKKLQEHRAAAPLAAGGVLVRGDVY
jgi:hypothetical protein